MKDYRCAKVIICSILMLSLLATGCNVTEDDGKNENIELLEPVGARAEYDVATERNMYSYEIFSSSVNPIVKEYAFSKEQKFKRYGAIPGQMVEFGDTLVYSETKSLDKQLEAIEEEIDDLESNHGIEVTRLSKDVLDARENEDKAYQEYYKIYRQEPEPCTVDHEIWEEMVHWPEFSYKNSVQIREKAEERYKEYTELYDLEHDYKLGKKQRIIDHVIDTTVVANTSGEIVACNYFSNGDVIPKDYPILAVGDTSSKVLQTEYIEKSTINKALDVYAIIDGKRYEIIYVNMEPEEQKQLTADGENVYTTFVLDDPDDEVAIGTYAAVVVEKDRRNKVLCVPNDAVKKESDGYYVYLYNGEDASYVPVEIGMRDGYYCEIISGLSKGDKVLSASLPKATKNTGKVTRGDYSIDAQINGYLYYPFSEWIINPAQSGKAYLKEILVEENEKVEKDQVVATLEVVPDQIEISRLNTQIARLQSRMEEMQVTKNAIDLKGLISYELNIKMSENERDTKIKKRELSKLNKYSGIIELKAPYDGVIMHINTIKPGELLAPDANIIEMANDSMSYVIVKDSKNQLNYGNVATITTSTMNGPVTFNGTVITVNTMCLSKKLANDFSLIAIPQEEIANLGGSVKLDTGRWDRNSYKVNVKVRSEKNVLIVPKAAVTVKDKSTYVTVLKADNSVERVSFIPGGSDADYYWVVDGLTEGMTLCWE